MGLNDSYMQARSQILLMTPLPSVNQAYAMIVSNEGKKAIASTSSGLLGSTPNCDSTTLYSKTNFQKFKKDYSVQCNYCKLKGHLKEHCWKLVGYLPNFKKKKGNGIGGGGSTGYNVMGEGSTSQNQHTLNKGSQFNVGSEGLIAANMTELYQGMDHGKVSQSSNINLPGTCVFIKEEYDQIFQMLRKNNCLSASVQATNSNEASGSLKWEGEGYW